MSAFEARKQLSLVTARMERLELMTREDAKRIHLDAFSSTKEEIEKVQIDLIISAIEGAKDDSYRRANLYEYFDGYLPQELQKVVIDGRIIANIPDLQKQEDDRFGRTVYWRLYELEDGSFGSFGGDCGDGDGWCAFYDTLEEALADGFS